MKDLSNIQLRTLLAESGLTVTDQTIRNWTRRGMPHRRADSGVFRFDAEPAVAWIADNVRRGTRLTHGGRRPKAGRKKQDPSLGGGLGLAMGDADARRGRVRSARATLGRITSEGRSLPPPAVLKDLSADEIRAIALLCAETPGLSRADLDRAETLTKTQLRQIEIDERRGRLVSAEETRARLTEHLNLVRKRIENAVPNIARRLITDLGLDPQTEAGVRAAVRAELTEAMRAIAADPRGHAAA